MKWEHLLIQLKLRLPVGNITTYGELSEHLLGHRMGGQAIRSMLEAAVNADYTNARFTNRVIYTDGRVADVHGQSVQLEAEGFNVQNNRIDLSQVNIVKFG
ncbi:hypothetical protein [Vibrio pacinii]|uniref:hypothetical protein n=1 Tax=Vibrio pacinii TaxID=170674 RepID=UPI00056FBB84|nr:hypothetical protein [Vibrio pacinii]